MSLYGYIKRVKMFEALFFMVIMGIVFVVRKLCGFELAVLTCLVWIYMAVLMG